MDGFLCNSLRLYDLESSSASVPHPEYLLDDEAQSGSLLRNLLQDAPLGNGIRTSDRRGLRAVAGLHIWLAAGRSFAQRHLTDPAGPNRQ